MTAQRLSEVPGFSIDRVADAAGDDPEILRLENLDTDLRPPSAALKATHEAVDNDDANSYLPFIGQRALREAATTHVSSLSGVTYDPIKNSAITAGGTEGLLNVLLATVNPGDEVILTDPTYAGMIYRVHLAGGIPRLVPFTLIGNEWRLDLDVLAATITGKSRMIFVMNPSMPSGAVFNDEEWAAISDLCDEHDLLLLYNAAMERILYDGRIYRHPASIAGMSDRVITVGSVSKEYRMIGWRVGWIVGPEALMGDIGRVGLYNVVTPVGLTQNAAAVALRTDASGVTAAVDEWERRRDVMLRELSEFRVIPAAGGWSMLMDVGTLGLGSFVASDRLLDQGIAATPMRDWGDVNSDQYVRLVFSNEPVHRLKGLGDRVDRAFNRTTY
jgi:aspartate/methionine/tyrosine aminotransferase